MNAKAWEKDFASWPIPGNIINQYFEGKIILTGKQGGKDWYRIQWESDLRKEAVYSDFFKSEHVYWELPIQGQLIDKTTWKKCTSVISLTTNASGTYISLS